MSLNNSKMTLNTTRLRATLAQTVNPTGAIVALSTFAFLCLLYIMYIKKTSKARTQTKPTEEPLDPVIEDILEEQDLANQLRINTWRMARLHKYLKKKYGEDKSKTLAQKFEDNATLMEQVRIQIKNSPKRKLIYSKTPTMQVDFATMMKEPEKVKHISSVAKLKIKMLPVEYQHRRKRQNFEHLKKTLLPVQMKRPTRKAPLPPELQLLKSKQLVSNSVFKNV